MKYIFPIMLVFLLVPALAFSQADFAVDTFSEGGVNLIITLTPLGKVTYDRVKAEQGDRIVEEMINLWLFDYANHYAKEDADEMNKRLNTLSLANKKKVLDLLDDCTLGIC